MRSSACLALAATAITTSNALQLLQRRDGVAPKVVQHEIQRRRDLPNILERDRTRRLRKRADTVSVSLDNDETLYFMNVTIGTPAQSLSLHIDTGSSDLWVNVANSTYCEGNDDPCTAAGTYDSSDSSTYVYVNSDFNITYEDGSGATGDYVKDTVAFGDVTLKGQQFGVGFTSTSAEGIIGIGYTANEVAASYGASGYANVPVSLVEQGYINSNAYSLWLNDLDASTGSILFGGINTDKYSGELETLPIITEDGVYAEFIIALTGVGANGTAGSIATGINSPALLDSGTSLMYLPDDIVQTIYDDTGAEYDSSEGAAFIDCDMANSDYTIDLTFSSPTISIAMSELVIVAGEERGEEVCILGIAPADGTTPVLGDTFLRSAYVVYDLYSNEISLAQTKFNGTTDNIVEITNSTGVPDSTTISSAVTDVSVATGSSGVINSLPDASTTISEGWAAPTAAVGYNFALLGAAGVGMAFAM